MTMMPLNQLKTTYKIAAYKGVSPCEMLLAQNFASNQILVPLLVTPDNEIIDGFKRFQYAQSHQIDAVPVTIMTSSEPEIVFDTLLSCHFSLIYKQVVSFADLYQIAKVIGLSDDYFVTHALSICGFHTHPSLLKDLRAIQDFPEPLKQFVSKKQFSYKQCKQLVRFDTALMLKLLSFEGKLQLTANHFLHLAELIHDTVSYQELSVQNFFSSADVQDIMSAQCSESQRTQKLIQYIFSKKQPTLKQLQDDISELANQIELPQGKVDWDRSLETQAVNVQAPIRTVDDLNLLVKSLDDPNNKHLIEKILEKL